MKHILGILLCYFCLFAFSLGNPPDSSLKFRNLRQQLFAVDYAKALEPPAGFHTAAEVVAFIEKMERAWADSMHAQSPTYQRLNAYVPMWTLRHLFKNPLPDSALQRVWSQFALPAFLADVADLATIEGISSVQLLEKAYLIRISNFSWGINPSFEYELPKDKWDQLYQACVQLPALIQTYGDTESFPNTPDATLDQVGKACRQVGSLMADVRPIVDLQDLLYQGEYTGAFDNLSTALPEAEAWIFAYAWLGRRLTRKYANQGAKEEALATLDLLNRHTSHQTLTRNTLLNLYEQVDSLQGPTRFEAISGALSHSLVTSTVQKQLAGSFYEFQSKHVISLNKLSGKLLLLDFWSLSCKPCLEEIPQLNALHEAFSEKITIVSINCDLRTRLDQEIILARIGALGIQYPVVLDNEASELMQRFGVGGWPTRFLLNQSGELMMEPLERRSRLSMKEILDHLNTQ